MKSLQILRLLNKVNTNKTNDYEKQITYILFKTQIKTRKTVHTKYEHFPEHLY